LVEASPLMSKLVAQKRRQRIALVADEDRQQRAQRIPSDGRDHPEFREQAPHLIDQRRAHLDHSLSQPVQCQDLLLLDGLQCDETHIGALRRLADRGRVSEWRPGRQEYTACMALVGKLTPPRSWRAPAEAGRRCTQKRDYGFILGRFGANNSQV